MDHRYRNGRMYWKVKWKGHTEPTWEPAKSFMGDIQIDWWEYNKTNSVQVDVTDIPVRFVGIDFVNVQQVC